MPWCPICKNEYKEGYTHCSDCDIDLVESLENMPQAIIFGEQSAIEDMRTVLENGEISGCFIHYDESSRQYELYVPQDKVDEARHMLQTYMQEIMQQMEDAGEEQEQEQRDNISEPVYEDKHQKAEEYKSSAWALILVGGAGLAAMILLLLDVLPFHLYGYSKILTGTVMCLLFGAFLLMGISSAKQYRKGLEIADKEDELIKKIRAFAGEKLTREHIDTLAGISHQNEVDEMQYYYQRIDVMKAQIDDAFHPERALLEKITDDLYTEIFEIAEQ